MAAKTTLEKLLDLAGKFVIEQKGEWQHDDWERLLAKTSSLGMEFSDENKRNLGNILESCKYFYACGAGTPSAAKKAPAKKKAAAKPKAKKS